MAGGGAGRRVGRSAPACAAPVAALTCAALVAALACAPAAAAGTVSRVGSIALPGVKGQLDHMALDEAGQRLFVAALGNHTVEVVDLRTARRVRSLTGFREPQGLGFLPSPPRLFVACGGDGRVAVLDAESFQPLRDLRLGHDADNVRVDDAARRVIVGFGAGGLAVLDAASGDSVATIALAAHPEAFECEEEGPRIFVNVPESHEVTVVDRDLGRAVGHWPLEGSGANFPMAFDRVGSRLFLGCRRPAELVVLSTATGGRLDSVATEGDVDDLAYDVRSHTLLASCGAGFLDVIDVPIAGGLHVRARIPTESGARTSLLDAARGRLYLAVPAQPGRPAEIRIYELARE